MSRSVFTQASGLARRTKKELRDCYEESVCGLRGDITILYSGEMGCIVFSIRLFTDIVEFAVPNVLSLVFSTSTGLCSHSPSASPYAQASAVIRMKRITIGLARCRLFSPSLGKPSATATRLMEGISPCQEQRTSLRFIHKWACVFENLYLYLSLQLANIEARMGVGGSLYAKPIYLQPRAKLGKVFHSCNRFIHFLQKKFFRE